MFNSEKLFDHGEISGLREKFRIKALAAARLIFLVCFFWGGNGFCDEWVLAVEPSFMDHQMRRPINGSRRTILAVARFQNGEIKPLDREEKKNVHMTFDQIRAEALKNASALLAGLKPRFVRDKNKVIRHAIIESEDPRTASCVLAPDFAEKFRDTLGPDLMVAMPNRYQVLVFSRQDDAHMRMSEFIINGYLSSNYPVSREIFALEGGNLRSLGVLQ